MKGNKNAGMEKGKEVLERGGDEEGRKWGMRR